MKDKTPNRAFERYDYETPIMFTCHQDHPYCYYGARMFNHSIGGMYFESRYPLEPGSVAYFNRAGYMMEQQGADIYKPHCVVVKWCKPLLRREDAFYGIGVQFVDPATCKRKSGVQIMQDAMAQYDAETIVLEEGQSGNMDPACELTTSETRLKTAMETATSRAKKLAVLNRFATSVGSTLDLNEILQAVCKEMTQIFEVRNTGIGLLDSRRTKITLVAFYSADPEESDATGMEMAIQGNAATLRVVETGQSIVVPDVQHNPLTESIHDIARQRGTECLMIVPLLARGEVVGTIGMPTGDKNRVFTTEEVALAQTIASQIASAIDNARLYEKTEKAREIAERDLEIGQKIQTEFFPKILPSVKGWEIAAYFEPARKVSGDFYDLFDVCGGHRLVMVIADVCDHGVGSALFMVLFRSLIRAYAEPSFMVCADPQTPDAASIREALRRTVERTNIYIARTHESSGRFATLFVGVLDPESGMLHYINCGHEAPPVIGQNGIRTRLRPTGPALGLDPDLRFSVESVHLETSQILMLYTDGLADAQNEAGGYFTKKRLTELMDRPWWSAKQLVDETRERLMAHVGQAERYDDVTLMAIKRE